MEPTTYPRSFHCIRGDFAQTTEMILGEANVFHARKSSLPTMMAWGRHLVCTNDFDRSFFCHFSKNTFQKLQTNGDSKRTDIFYMFFIFMGISNQW